MTQKHVEGFSYVTNNVLGEGSTGTVYLGVDGKNGRQVAIKAINMKDIDNDVTKYLLQNEIKALQLVNHQNVLKAVDIIRQPDYCYVVTQYLQGKTLKQIISSRGRLPEAQALSIFKAIVEGYNNLLGHRIIHRDLKPQNIMFTSTGVPVLIDFGYCEIAGFMNKPKMFYNVGSPAYMAPESIVSSLYNENSEVWSLGAILYEMLQGKPFMTGEGKNVMQAMMNLKRTGVPVPVNASEFSKSLIRQCMKLKATDRIKIKDLMNQLSTVPNTSANFPTQPIVPMINEINHVSVPQVAPQIGPKIVVAKSLLPQEMHNQSFAYGAHNRINTVDVLPNRPSSFEGKFKSSHAHIVVNNRSSMPAEIKGSVLQIQPITQAVKPQINTFPRNMPNTIIQSTSTVPGPQTLLTPAIVTGVQMNSNIRNINNPIPNQNIVGNISPTNNFNNMNSVNVGPIGSPIKVNQVNTIQSNILSKPTPPQMVNARGSFILTSTQQTIPIINTPPNISVLNPTQQKIISNVTITNVPGPQINNLPPPNIAMNQNRLPITQRGSNFSSPLVGSFQSSPVPIHQTLQVNQLRP